MHLDAAIKPRELVTVTGSGNYGETGASAFYTFDELPQPLLDMAPYSLERADIDLGEDRLAFYIDEARRHRAPLKRVSA